MYSKILACALIVVLGMGPAGAEEPTVAEAKTAEEIEADKQALGVSGTPKELRLRYDEVFAERAANLSLQEEISIDLINLDELRGAIQSQAGDASLELSLGDCIGVALRQNPDIIIAGFGPPRSEYDILAARGEFDPAAQTDIDYIHTQVTASQQEQLFGDLDEIETYRTDLLGTVGGKLHTGTQYGLNFNLNKEENSFSSFIEEFQVQLGFSITQPLLRGLGRKVNKVRILAAENNRAISEEQLKLQVMNTLAEVVRGYWDLVGAVENVKVQEEALDNAERLLRINTTRREIGTAADIDVLQAKAGVASRQSDLISARSTVADASDRLKQLLDLREDDLFSRALIVPTDRPSPEDLSLFEIDKFEEARERSVQRALDNRPEVFIAELQIDNAELDRARARNDMMPQFDINGFVASGGRDHKLSEALEGIVDRDHEYYGYGLLASVPLGNRAARGAYERSKVTVRESEAQRQKTLQGLMAAVHISMRSVFTNRILVESNQQTRRLQEANVVAEEKRLRLGVTTSYQVLLVQQDLTAAQTLEVQALTAYEKALVDLRLAEGMLLDQLNIEFEIPETPEAVGFWGSVTPRWE